MLGSFEPSLLGKNSLIFAIIFVWDSNVKNVMFLSGRIVLQAFRSFLPCMSIADSDFFIMLIGKSRSSVLFVGELFEPIAMPPEENSFAMFVLGANSSDAASFEKLSRSGSFGLLSHAIILTGIIEDRIHTAINFETRMFFPIQNLRVINLAKFKFYVDLHFPSFLTMQFLYQFNVFMNS